MQYGGDNQGSWSKQTNFKLDNVTIYDKTELFSTTVQTVRGCQKVKLVENMVVKANAGLAC